MIELFLAGLRSQGNKRAWGVRAQGNAGQAVCCTWRGSHAGSRAPRSEVGLNVAPCLTHCFPESSARAMGMGPRGLDTASSSSSDPCMTSDPSLSLDLGFPFYKMSLMNDRSFNVPPPNMVAPRGDREEPGGDGDTTGHGAFLQHQSSEHTTFGVRQPTKLPSHPHLDCGQSRNRASVALKAVFPEGPGRLPFEGQKPWLPQQPATVCCEALGLLLPISVPQSLLSAFPAYPWIAI